MQTSAMGEDGVKNGDKRSEKKFTLQFSLNLWCKIKLRMELVNNILLKL
jgi:hypothetical protein